LNCKGICTREEYHCPQKNAYVLGFKRCSGCQIFVNMEGPYCKCCGGRLRNYPRKTSLKRLFRNKKIQNTIPIKKDDSAASNPENMQECETCDGRGCNTRKQRCLDCNGTGKSRIEPDAEEELVEEDLES